MAKYGPITFLSLGLVLLNLLAWIVLAAGASSLQHNATLLATVLNANGALSQKYGAPLTYGDIMPVNSPSRFISYQWFKAVFQIVTILITAGVLVTGQLYRFRVALVALFAALGVFYADSCQTFFYIHGLAKAAHTAGDVPTNINREITTWFVGCILSATLDFLLVLSLGISSDPRPTEVRTTGYNEPHTHTGTGVGNGGTAAADMHKTAI